jgi:hypothetical protein
VLKSIPLSEFDRVPVVIEHDFFENIVYPEKNG